MKMNLFKSVDDQLETIARTFRFTNVIGLTRTVLASGTLLTLLANPVSNFVYILNSGKPTHPTILEDTLANKMNFFLLLGIDSIWVMKLLAIVVLLLVISGYFIKLTSVLHWWVAWSFMGISAAIDGGDQIANNLSFLLIPICFLDNRKNHWDSPINAGNKLRRFSGFFALQLIRLQVALIYFHACVGKLPVTEWADGTAVYYWFSHSAFGMSDFFHSFMDPLLSSNYGVMLLTFGTLLFELVLFLCFTMPIKYRKYFLGMALVFHFAIIVFHGIFSFFFSIAAALILYLSNYNQEIKIRSTKKVKILYQNA